MTTATDERTALASVSVRLKATGRPTVNPVGGGVAPGRGIRVESGWNQAPRARWTRSAAALRNSANDDRGLPNPTLV